MASHPATPCEDEDAGAAAAGAVNVLLHTYWPPTGADAAPLHSLSFSESLQLLHFNHPLHAAAVHPLAWRGRTGTLQNIEPRARPTTTNSPSPPKFLPPPPRVRQERGQRRIELTDHAGRPAVAARSHHCSLLQAGAGRAADCTRSPSRAGPWGRVRATPRGPNRPSPSCFQFQTDLGTTATKGGCGGRGRTGLRLFREMARSCGGGGEAVLCRSAVAT